MEAYVIDHKTLKTKDNFKLLEGDIYISLHDIGNFELKVFKENLEIEDYISIFDEGNIIFSGIIKKIDDNENKISGYSVKYELKNIQYFNIMNISPVATTTINTYASNFINQLLSNTFQKPVIMHSSFTDFIYKSEIRLKNIFNIMFDLTFNNDINYDIYLFGNGKYDVYLKKNRNLFETIKLITNITHDVIEKIEDRTETYNQIIGLGSGESEARDFVFIDNSLNEKPRCYTYDVRENITHEELEKRTIEKLESFKSDYYAKFRVKDNNLYRFGKDYFIGDYVTFSGLDGAELKDLITSCKLKLEKGNSKLDYEVSIGKFKGTLTDKINEIKEGGYK